MNILLAIEHADQRLALELLLSQEPGAMVLGTASETEGLLALIRTSRPDLVVLDWRLPGRPAPDVLAEAQTLLGRLKFVVLGRGPEVKQQALNAGAQAFVVVGDPPEQFLAALRQVRRLLKLGADNDSTAP